MEATIGSGARVNQEATLSTAEQTVTVNAALDAVLIEVGQMASLNISAAGIAEALFRNQSRADKSITDFLTDIANPFGVSGKKAAGGTMLLTLAENTTTAEIRDGAFVAAGDAGGVDVSATHDFYNVAFVQTGTGSTDFGFSASIAASNITSTTRASIVASARINAGALNVKANDNLDRINHAGAILKGKKTGIGTSVGVNTVCLLYTSDAADE